MVAVTDEPAALFNVIAPDNVSELLIEIVDPEPVKVNDPPLLTPFSVTTADTFETVIAPVVVNASILWVPLPAKTIGELLKLAVPLLIKSP